MYILLSMNPFKYVVIKSMRLISNPFVTIKLMKKTKSDYIHYMKVYFPCSQY